MAEASESASSHLSRPVSIFSTSSTASMESSAAETSTAESGDDHKRLMKARTLPRPSSIKSSTSSTSGLREEDRKLRAGIHYFNKKPTKGIQYLIKNFLLEDDPKKVADFFLKQAGLSKEKIGEFLGDINSEFNMAVLESIVECSYMGNKPIDEALREFQQVFRMPGEAQKIDKIMEVFALEYYKHNSEGQLFKSEDAAYILSFAIMMLHTALHNPSVKSRTSKKQWLSMNRGTNDGDNFPQSFLLEIFDRIQATEFATGKDHTHMVVEIEKQIIGLPIQNLSVPHRYLSLKMSASEVQELGVRPGFRNKHRRTLFFFNDIVIICKRKHSNEFLFRETFSLLNMLPVKFETHYYKYGVQLHAVDRDSPFQLNCDSSADREQLLQSLERITQQLQLLESERIAALGTSLQGTTSAADSPTEKGGRRKSMLVCDVGELISSMSFATGSSEPPSVKSSDDFVPGVGDLLVTTSLPINFTKTDDTENRISRDSGFSSQQLTPTPPQSPLDGTSEAAAAANPAPYAVTPNNVSPYASLPLGVITTVTATPMLAPSSSGTPPRSKSSETLKQHLVTPSSPSRSPSMDFLKRRKSTPTATAFSTSTGAAAGTSSSSSPQATAKSKKKERVSSDKAHKKGIFSFNSKAKSKGSRESSYSPQMQHRKLEQNLSMELSFEESVEASSATLPLRHHQLASTHQLASNAASQ